MNSVKNFKDMGLIEMAKTLGEMGEEMKSFVCSPCGKRFLKPHQLQKHIDDIHQTRYTPTPFTLGRINALIQERFNAEDAAFIACSVNCHEELLKAAKFAAQIIRENGELSERIVLAHNELDQAIVKAESVG